MVDTFFLDSIAYFLSSTLPCMITSFLQDLLWCSLNIVGLLCASFKLIIKLIITRNEPFVDEKEAQDEDSRAERCDGCSDNKGELTYDGATMVMRRLGVLGWSEKLEVCTSERKCGECSLVEEARVLMEEKEASLEELEEAFYVFDRNEDGFISPAELWNVMRRLGLQEGFRYEDCERMVGAFDGDGDGRISFPEFKIMMENTV